LAGKRGAAGDELDDGWVGKRDGRAGDRGSFAGACGRAGMDRLRSADGLSADELSADELSADELSADKLSADKLWRDGDASSASLFTADGVCGADGVWSDWAGGDGAWSGWGWIGVDAVSLHEPVCG
jgi:hypothetical protein